MSTAILFTSRHGTTAKVAQMVAERLTDNQVSIIDLKKEKRPDIHPFDGIILGTSIYASAPSKTMQRFCKENIEALKQKRLALFVCGMEPNVDKQQQELTNAYPQELSQQAVSTCFAGGEFQFEKMNFFERAIIKRIAKTEKSVSDIKEGEIDRFVTELLPFIYPEVNVMTPLRGGCCWRTKGWKNCRKRKRYTWGNGQRLRR